MSRMIERYQNDRSEWSSSDHLEYQRHGTKPVRSEWQEARAEALRKAGVEDDAPVRVEDMSPEQHLKRLRKR
jgi:hypothetical protein